MPQDLSLIPTEELVQEIIKRHDVCLITTYQNRREGVGIQKWGEGPSLELLGLLRITEWELLEELAETRENLDD